LEEGGRLVLVLTHEGPGQRAVEIEMAPLYGVPPGEDRKRSLVAASGRPARAVWSLAASDGWYDIAVTSPETPGFVRHYAGHLETGRASRTDPAIGPMRL
jgi:phospholipase C